MKYIHTTFNFTYNAIYFQNIKSGSIPSLSKGSILIAYDFTGCDVLTKLGKCFRLAQTEDVGFLEFTP